MTEIKDQPDQSSTESYPDGRKSVFSKECQATKKNGEKCRSFAIKDGWCSVHNPISGPAHQKKVQASKKCKVPHQKKLTVKERYLMLERLGFPKKFTSSSDVDKVMIALINRITMGEVPPTSGKTLLGLCQEANKKFRRQEAENKKSKKISKGERIGVEIKEEWV